jgi:hypothetical protein
MKAMMMMLENYFHFDFFDLMFSIAVDDDDDADDQWMLMNDPS